MKLRSKLSDYVISSLELAHNRKNYNVLLKKIKNVDIYPSNKGLSNHVYKTKTAHKIK